MAVGVVVCKAGRAGIFDRRTSSLVRLRMEKPPTELPVSDAAAENRGI